MSPPSARKKPARVKAAAAKTAAGNPAPAQATAGKAVTSKALPRKTPAAKHHARVVFHRLRKAYPQAPCALVHNSPFELLVATILSAQCTDARVNLVTPALFQAYPDAQQMAAADASTLEGLVQSTGFFRSKARHIKAMAEQLMAVHGGEVPKTLTELVALPGVARKTASVVLGVCFGLAEGVVVDTHVLRLSLRLGLSAHQDAKRVELDLMASLPQTDWILLSHRLIAHGRTCCKARSPACGTCPLASVCPSLTAFIPAGKTARE